MKNVLLISFFNLIPWDIETNSPKWDELNTTAHLEGLHLFIN